MKKIVRISSILFVATPLMLLNSPKVEAAQVASIQSNADMLILRLLLIILSRHLSTRRTLLSL